MQVSDLLLSIRYGMPKTAAILTRPKRIMGLLKMPRTLTVIANCQQTLPVSAPTIPQMR